MRLSPLPLLLATTLAASAQPPAAGVVGTWRLVRIDSPGAGGKPAPAPKPLGLLLYTAGGHASIQLMYPDTSLQTEFVHDGYEATFGTYTLDAPHHRLTYHVEASATRDRLVGKTETLTYDLPDPRHMIIRPADPAQHWSVTWERAGR